MFFLLFLLKITVSPKKLRKYLWICWGNKLKVEPLSFAEARHLDRVSGQRALSTMQDQGVKLSQRFRGLKKNLTTIEKNL